MEVHPIPYPRPQSRAAKVEAARLVNLLGGGPSEDARELGISPLRHLRKKRVGTGGSSLQHACHLMVIYSVSHYEFGSRAITTGFILIKLNQDSGRLGLSVEVEPVPPL